MATMMPMLRARLRRLCAEAGPEQAEDVLQTLTQVMQGVKQPNPERHRIRLSNPALFTRLTQYESAVEVLEACGWEFVDIHDGDKADEIWMGFPVESPNVDLKEVDKEIKDQMFEVTGIEEIEQLPSTPSSKPLSSTPSSKPLPGPFRAVPAAVPIPKRAVSRRPPIPARPPPIPARPSRMQLADLVEHRLRSGVLSAPNATGTIRLGGVSNLAMQKQLKEIRQKQHQKYAQSRGRKRFATIADFAAADIEEETRIARIGRFAQRDRKRNANFTLKQIGELALKYTNEFRATRGLPALRWHQYLADIGADHSQDMADGKTPFSHQGFKERVAMYPMKSNMAAENLARVGGYDPAKVSVDGWIKSPGHCKNLLSNTKWCGIGVVPCGSQYMLTQLFG